MKPPEKFDFIFVKRNDKWCVMHVGVSISLFKVQRQPIHVRVQRKDGQVIEMRLEGYRGNEYETIRGQEKLKGCVYSATVLGTPAHGEEYVEQEKPWFAAGLDHYGVMNSD